MTTKQLYLYGKSIQNCNWYLILTGDHQTIATYVHNHPELYNQYHSLQTTDKEIN